MVVYVRIGIAAQRLGVCIKTIRRWDKAGKIRCCRTTGGHRRITVIEIRRLQGQTEVERTSFSQQTAIYARVSSHEQKKKGELARQIQVAQDWCQREENREKRAKPVIFTDVGSGLNTKRRGLQKLWQAIEKGQITRIVVTYQDRLTRLGFQYLKSYFHSHGAIIRCVQQTQKQTPQEELVADLIAIVTSFSGRVHGLRSHKNKRRQKTKIKVVDQ